MACSTVVSPAGAALSMSTSVAFDAAAAATTRSASAWNSAFLATKSVSELSSIRAPSLAATRPSAVARSARLPTSLAPLMRSSSTALSKSPSASSSAFLQSIMPAPVSSRSFLTSAAVKFDMLLSLRVSVRGWRVRPPACLRDVADGLLGRLGHVSGVRRRVDNRGRGSRLGTAGLYLLGRGEQLALPLGQRLVHAHRTGGRLLVAATRAAGAGDEA